MNANGAELCYILQVAPLRVFTPSWNVPSVLERLVRELPPVE